jgi:hypothetical protein
MAKAPIEIRSLARQHTEEAINALLRILRKEDATDSAVVAASSAILDRGWGKPTQVIQGDEDGGPITITWLKS